MDCHSDFLTVCCTQMMCRCRIVSMPIVRVHRDISDCTEARAEACFEVWPE